MPTASITPILPPRSKELLDACQKMASQRLPAAVHHVLTQVDDVLFKMANTADNSSQQNRYFDGLREIRIKRDEIERSFMQNFDATFVDSLELGRAHAGKGKSPFDGELSLVGVDEVEEGLAISNFVESMKARCGRELFALDKRMSVLLKAPELNEATNPLGPKAIGDALRRACKELESNIEVKLTLYKLFDKLASAELQQLYLDINKHLIKCDILPMISSQAPARPPARKTRVIIESNDDRVEVAGEDVFSTLEQLMQGSASSGARSGGAGAGGARSGGPTILSMGGGGLATAGGGTPGAVAGLVGLGQGGGVSGAGGGFLSVPALVDTLTSLQRSDGSSGGEAFAGGFEPTQLVAGNVNVLRGLRSSGAIGQMAPAQDMTLEIVSLLFDYILDDPSIPDALKALIGRLQIPVLKVAILDKDVFSRKTHPARRLLDALARASVGWSQGSQKSDALYEQIEHAVRRVVSEFEDDVGLFAQVLEEFNAFLADDVKAAEQRAEASSRSLQTREQIVLAKMEVDEEINARMRGYDVREFVQHFLFDYWRQLLIITHVEAGKHSEAWQRQLSTVDDLVWSVQPKTTSEDRKELSTRLPKMLKIVKAGMVTLEMPPPECSRFLSMLASVHVVAIKNMEESSIAARKLAQTAAKSDAQTVPDAAASEAESEEFVKQGIARLLERKGVGTIELDIDFSAFEPDPDKTAENTIATVDADLARYVEEVTTLDLGDWVEFVLKDGTTIRGRFTWISPASGRYLFTSRQGEKMLDTSLLDLAREFQAGSATIIRAETDPLMDRALAALIDKLEAESVAS